MIEAGTIIDGFRVERRLAAGSLGRVYEATQLSLGRSVALRLIDGGADPDPEFARRQRLSASVHHPNLVPVYEAGTWGGGRYVASRFVRGSTLAEALAKRSLTSAQLRAALDGIASGLAAAHAAGLAHGRVSARNVLIDAKGTAYLADLGLGRPGEPEDDREALSSLGEDALRGLKRRRARAVTAMALAGAAATVALVAAATGGEGPAPDPPGVQAGLEPLGSELVSSPAASIGCGADPGPNTPACTLSQAAIGGRAVRVREAGVIRDWAVAGASGDLTLQVIGRRGGRPYLRSFSQVERASGEGPEAFAANVPVERGDRIGVLLSPGAVIGAGDVPEGAPALRWEGALSYEPSPARFQRFDGELMLRADIEPGARPDLRQITGRQAAAASAGETLDATLVHAGPGSLIRVEVVRVGGAIALDAFRGRQRLARVSLPDAAPGGRLIPLEAQCGYARGFCFRWFNEGDAGPIVHAYRLIRDGEAFRLIG